MSELPTNWQEVQIVEVIAPNDNGKPFQQGWSPQCERVPAPEGAWGVLKTTAIQHGEFRPHENKALPVHLEPRPQIEVKAGDVVMTCAGPRNRCGVACLVEHTRPRLMLSGKMYRFRPRPDGLVPKYLAYLFQRHETQLEIDRMKTGINDSGLNLTHDRFAALKVPLAPLREQQRIVAKIDELFSELDNAAESLTLARAQLKTYRQALLKAAFEGKLTTDWRAANPDKLEPPETILARIRAEHLEAGNSLPCEPSEQPSPTEASTGWAWASVDMVAAENLIGLVRAASEQNGESEGVSYIKMDRIDMDGRVDTAAHVFVEATPAEVERYALKCGDLLFNTRNSLELVGKTGLVRSDPKQPTLFNNNLMRIRSVPAVLPGFLAYQMCGQTFRRRMERIKKATTSVAAVYGKDLWPLPILVPSTYEQAEIVRILDEKLSVVEVALSENENHFARIVALRQSVLKKAFSGMLVAQDPTDEPAAALLARLREEAPALRTHRRKTA